MLIAKLPNVVISESCAWMILMATDDHYPVCSTPYTYDWHFDESPEGLLRTYEVRSTEHGVRSTEYGVLVAHTLASKGRKLLVIVI